jgi:hypothetical protein
MAHIGAAGSSSSGSPGRRRSACGRGMPRRRASHSSKAAAASPPALGERLHEFLRLHRKRDGVAGPAEAVVTERPHGPDQQDRRNPLSPVPRSFRTSSARIPGNDDPDCDGLPRAGQHLTVGRVRCEREVGTRLGVRPPVLALLVHLDPVAIDLGERVPECELGREPGLAAGADEAAGRLLVDTGHEPS